MRRPLGEDFARGWPDGPDDDRPRVLFESPDGAEAHATWKLLRRHGYHTMWCPGPQGGFSTECTLTATGRCPLVGEADAVVAALDLRDPRCEAVVRGLDAQAAETPVVVVTPRGATVQWAGELPHSQVVAGPLSSKVLIRSLAEAGAPWGPAPAG
jgi:hypothetical protein